MIAKNPPQATPAAAQQCAPLGTILINLGARLGALDQRSRMVMGELLKQLVEVPDDASEIASMASALARVQKPMVKDAALHRAMTCPDARAFVVPKAGQL